jgi:hypothetical protein
MPAARRPGLEQRRATVDFPEWMIESLDREARRLGVNRQSIIKVWIAERLERGAPPAWHLACLRAADCRGSRRARRGRASPRVPGRRSWWLRQEIAWRHQGG